MRVTFWGTRGSLPSPGAGTARHGGNTSCVEVRTDEGNLVVLDAGSGIAPLGRALGEEQRIDILLTHLHLDHIQGLGFFEPLFRRDTDVHVWGPSSTTHDLRERLMRYLSPPLFPLGLRDLPARLKLHDVPLRGWFEVPGAMVHAALICHPGPTVGYRIVGRSGSLAYLSDHEPALGVRNFPLEPAWTSGYDVAAGVDLLIHDTQYTAEEYESRVGWGHSTIDHAVAFAGLVGARRMAAFHHDPAHDDDFLDRFLGGRSTDEVEVVAACEGATLEVRSLSGAARRSRSASG